MDHFVYRGGTLHAEDVALSEIARGIGTPFYCYSSATLERHYRVFAEALEGVNASICYALKANSNLAVVRTLARLGAGADVVSEGELRRALKAGVAPERIVFSGVGKTRQEIAAAIEAGIGQFNVESEPELNVLDEIARARGVRAPMALRVNPDVDADTHDKIATGRKEDKFGIAIERAPEIYARAATLPGIEITGLACHIGSQLTALDPFREAFACLTDLAEHLIAEGHAIARLDLGGGLGIPYEGESPPEPSAYGALVREMTQGFAGEVVLEPGRVIAGNAGLLITTILYVKEGATKRFVIVDAAMNDLLRPALYDARHRVVPLAEPPAEGPLEPAEIVGPVCESGDVLAWDAPLPAIKSGDLLAVRTAGAYGAVMASTYNSRLLVPEVLVKGAEFALVRARPDYEDLIGLDRVPDWLDEPVPKSAATAKR